MRREKNRKFLVTVAMALGIGVVMPSYTFATVEQVESAVELGQIVKGTVIENWGNEFIVKGEDEKRYHIGLHSFDEDKIQTMNIAIGDSVQVEGEVLESVVDFYDFAYFAKSLPIGVTPDEIIKLEGLYNQARVLEKDELWEEASAVWVQMDKIMQPYYLANWEPEAFEDYISMFELPFSSDDLIRMEGFYNEWIVLAKSGNEEEANIKMENFFEIITSYYALQSFDDYLAMMDITLSDADYPVIKQLYDDIRQAEKDGNDELIIEKWEAFYLAMEPYHRAAYQLPTFEEQMSYYDLEISDEDLSQLEEIYASILDLESNGNYEHDQWEAFYNILESYFVMEEGIPFRAKQVTINGEVFS